jgi:hypothetical protein
MADSNYTIGLKVATTSDDAALERTTTGLERLHTEAQRGGGIWKDLGTKVLGFIAAFVGFQKVVGWLRSAFQGAVDAQSSLIRLTNTMLAFDPATRRTAEGVREWAEALGKLTGVGHEVTEGIVMRFLPVLKNTEAAMHLASVAALAQKRGWTDAASAADLLGNAIMGKPVRGTDILSRLLYEGHLSGEDFAVTLDKIEKALATAATAAEAAALKLARMKEQQQETKEAVGTTFLGLLDALQPVAKGFALFIAGVVSGFAFIIEHTKLVAKNLYAAGAFLIALPSGAKKAWQEYNQAIADNAATMRENFGQFARMVADIRKAFDKDTSAIDALSAKAEEDAKRRIAEVYARLKAEREREANAAKAKEAAERLAKQTAQETEEKYKLQHETLNRKVGAAASLKVEEDLNAKILASLRLHEGRVLQIKKLTQANIKKMGAQELADYIAELKKELAAETATMEQRNALTLQLAHAEYEIKTKGQQQIVQASLAAGQQIFASNKELSRGLAIVSAFAAAAGAARDTYGDVYARIAAYIATFAQVWAAVVGIGNTELKGGGGYAGAGVGPPRVYTGGAGGAGATASRGPTSTTTVTTNAPVTTVVNVNALDTTDALRSAQRALRPAGRAYDRALVSRGPVTVGSKRPR